MREFNDDCTDGHANDGPNTELVSLLDRLGAADRAGWSEADSARVASATAVLIEVPEGPAVVGSIGPGGARPMRRLAGGVGWFAGLAVAAALGVVAGVGLMLSQPATPTGGTSGGAIAMGDGASTPALDEEALEEELSVWLASRVRVDPVALLSADDDTDAAVSAWERDSLDELETDLASFWTMRSDLTGVDDGSEVEGTL